MNTEFDDTTATTEPEKKPSGNGLFKLDWETTEIDLAKGRFVHTLRRPDPELIAKRDDELQTAIPIAKDGSYSMPDPTLNDEVDAKYYDAIAVSATGYTGEIPELHKAKAFQGLYLREVAVDEDADIFADEVSVVEEIGGGVVPDFTITHVMRQPSESEIKAYRRKMTGTSEIKPGRRGRQSLVSRSNLKIAMQYYSLWMLRVEGATVNGETYSSENRDAFLATVDPLIQRHVVTTFANAITNELLD